MKLSGVRIRNKITAMIPARMGSTRLPRKNLALLGGKPLISYAIAAAKKSGVFNRIVVNSENTLFAGIAKQYGVDFYKRPARWATSRAKSDSVVYDFVKNNPCDIIVWVNSISPLQSGGDIEGAVKYFIKKGLDSLITVKEEQVHCLYKGRPVNFRRKGVFARTQDLTPVQPFVYSVMMWRTSSFMRTFEKRGRAVFSGKVGFYPVGKPASVIIKRKEDLMLAEFLLRVAKKKSAYRVKYVKGIKAAKGGPKP
ncbi:MAG: hypothetical protein NG740_05835 [Omnitrophica bacterium]|nr:hypothetical protein [Candidatus Omnitrophota bacterium]